MATAAALTIQKDADLKKQIKSAPATGYLLFGEEDYLKSLAVSAVRQELRGDEAFACFNELILDAQELHPEQLRSALMPLPMMAERKVILLQGLRPIDMKAAELDALCDVLAELKDYDYNTLLVPIAAGGIDEGYLPRRPSAQLTKLCEHLVPVRYERCTPQRLIGWCVRHFAHHGVEATPQLCETLIEHCGTSMLTLAGEIDKISFYVLAHGKAAVTAEDVTSAACPSPEYDAFALTNALMERDTARALEVLAELSRRRAEPVFILGEVIKTACDMLSVLLLTRQGKTPAEVAALLKLHDFKVALCRKHATAAGEGALRRMIEACMVADRALKRSPQGYAALETLICSL